MHKKSWLFPALRFPFRFMAADDPAGGGVAPAANPAPANPAPAADPAPAPAAAAKWWEGLSDTQKSFLTPKGLTVDNPMDALPKIIDIASNAEKRIGKGLDNIIEKPGKDQKLSEWMRGNAAALGLPDKEEGYAVEPPDFWPKEAKWDTALEGKARKLAFDAGVPADVHKAYVGLFAEKMKAMNDEAEQGMVRAQADMMADLQKDFGARTDAVITQAKQAAQLVAEKAGLSSDQLQGVGQLLSDKTGDAGVIRLFAALAEALGEDAAVAIGKGGALTMTPADARAELSRMQSPEGDYGKAFAAGDHRRMTELKPRIEQLSKIAAQR
jgi:hypothetical protein